MSHTQALPAINLLDLVSRDLGAPQRKHGREWYAFVCPFHADGTRDGGSLMVTPRNGRWYCFGCGIGGDAAHWLQRRRGLSRAQALRTLGIARPPRNRLSTTRGSLRSQRTRRQTATPADGTPPAESAPSRAWQQVARRVVAAGIAGWHTDTAQPARSYLHRRGLTDDTLARACIGYNPQPYSVTLDGQRLWMPRCILIPTFVDDDLWNVTLRLPTHDKGSKYRQLTGSLAALYGTASLSGKSTVLVCEGAFDALLIQQHSQGRLGVVSTTGGAGTSHTEWNVYLMLCQHLLLLYDADAAGEKGLSKLLHHFRGSARVLTLPSGKDPTEFYQHAGAPAFDTWLHDTLTHTEVQMKSHEDT